MNSLAQSGECIIGGLIPGALDDHTVPLYQASLILMEKLTLLACKFVAVKRIWSILGAIFVVTMMIFP